MRESNLSVCPGAERGSGVKSRTAAVLHLVVCPDRAGGACPGPSALLHL